MTMCWPLMAWSPLMESAGSASTRPPASRPWMRKRWTQKHCPARCSFASCGGSSGVAFWTPPPRRICAHGRGWVGFPSTHRSASRARTERVSSGSFATVLGGPLALERLHAPAGIEALSSPEARLIDRLPEPNRHGREMLRLTPLELLERLAHGVSANLGHRHCGSATAPPELTASPKNPDASVSCAARYRGVSWLDDRECL